MSKQLLTVHPAIGLEGLVSLLKTTDCRILLHSRPPIPAVHDISSAIKLDAVEVPELNEWLDGKVVPALEYTKTLIEVYDKPFWVTHSSGTTGLPKPTVFTHGAFSSRYASFSKIPTSESLQLVYNQFRNQRVLVAVPLSTAAGLFHILGFNLVYSHTVVLPPPWTAMTAACLNTVHIHGKVQATMTTPKCLTELSHFPTYLENLRRIEYIVYLGAPCPPHLGSLLAERTKLTTIYGNTESGAYPNEITDAEDWEYLRFHKRFPHELRHVCLGLYEMVLLRDQGAAFQGVFDSYPDLKEYRVQDLFARHTTKPDIWIYRGRTEDLIRSSHGELFLPKQMEALIETHPYVQAALIYDRGAAGLSLVIEVRWSLRTGEEREKLLDDIWPAVQNANGICPVETRIKRGLVLCADSERMLPRGAKGYPQRGKVLEVFGRELDELYRKEDEKASGAKRV